MESLEERQKLEITALSSIYGSDFFESPPARAWKGAPRLPEFVIKVAHAQPEFADRVFCHINVKFPKTYPTMACPTFDIQHPMQGLRSTDVTSLNHAIRNEAQHYKGSEMVFQIITFIQEWLTENIAPPLEPSGSLATEMIKRASEQDRARRRREEEEAQAKAQQEAQLAEEINDQIQADLHQQYLERERHHQQSRGRAMSDVTEVPPSEEVPTEFFHNEIDWKGVRFRRVKLFHPQKDCLGTVYLADPVCEDVQTTPKLELTSITFESHYYSSTQGLKKLQHLESEIRRLTNIRNDNLLAVLAVKLITQSMGPSRTPPRIVILSDQRPPVCLFDILQDSDSLREERITDYLKQILIGLNALHAAEIVHRGLTPRLVGLAPAEKSGQSKQIKLFKAAYHVRLQDLHRSDPFGVVHDAGLDDHIPERWLPKDAVDSPLVYSKSRDIHSVGLVLLQMILGHDVMEKYRDPQTALQSSQIPSHLQSVITSMLSPTKKNHVSCLSLLAELRGACDNNQRTPSIAINGGPKTPVWQSGSPEQDYFRSPSETRRASRWKEDWEELELLGRGGFGSVVKARNKIDSRIYAVKKIRLRATQGDHKIFREVNALSRLNHRFIVRYFTTWVETSDSISNTVSDSEETTEDGKTSRVISAAQYSDPLAINLDDFDEPRVEVGDSFADVTFLRMGSKSADAQWDSDDGLFEEGPPAGQLSRSASPPPLTRTLYIQMEFVERQTLKERIAEGLTEKEAWRLFQQLIDALVYMSSMGILHRDIKLTNIFIDGNGDCKVGDFGLATSSLAAVDPSDVTNPAINDGEMTADVGTALYIAPEVRNRSKNSPRDHAKADMFSLGIVFFEMNYKLSTEMERDSVLRDLRKKEILFPADWDRNRIKQRSIIEWLLQHNPKDRPTALELSQSTLLPTRLEDEYFKRAIEMLSKTDSLHYQTALSALFKQPVKPSRGFLYDIDASLPEHAELLNGIVQERLTQICRLHGAVDTEPPLLMPNVESETAEDSRALFLDRRGEVVALPNNALEPFARLAARTKRKRIKRFHIGDTYRPTESIGHPKFSKVAIFDIITPDLETGPSAATAEAILVANECLDNFPFGQAYEIHISHSNIIDIALSRVPQELRADTLEALRTSRLPPTQSSSRRIPQLRDLKGVRKDLLEELEIMMETFPTVDALIDKLERSTQLLNSLNPIISSLRSVIQFAKTSGVTRPILIRPLMVTDHVELFKNGVCFEVINVSSKHVLAAGGRYDMLISRFSPPQPHKSEPVCAVAVQIYLYQITSAVATFSKSLKFPKDMRSFGYWAPRRCDVYIVSQQPGHLTERLEVAALLWQHNISADVMYETGVHSKEENDVFDLCTREGILFIVYPKSRSARRDQFAFKVKSVLRGTEQEVSRQELVAFLQQQIAEQKRIDALITGLPKAVLDGPQSIAVVKDAPVAPDVQLLLPGDAKKQRKIKQMFLDRAFDMGVQLKNAAQNGMPMLAVDVPQVVFEEMTRNVRWLTDDDAWKAIVASFPAQHTGYAYQVRDAVERRRAEGLQFLLLFAVRDETVFLLNFTEQG